MPDDLCARLDAAGITTPFPIQSAVIPDALAGRDVTGRAPTGSGKTLGFGIPLVARLAPASRRRPTALVLAPTRELAEQIATELRPLARPRRHDVVAVYGGVGYGPQRKALDAGAELVVACPGRLEDLIAMRAVASRRRPPGRRRRGRPDGRHGLPPRRAAHPRPDPRRPSGPAVLGDARRRRRHPGDGDATPAGAPRGRPGGSGHHRRPAPVLGGRAHRPARLPGGDHRGPRVDDGLLPHPPRRRSPRHAARQARRSARPRSTAGAASRSATGPCARSAAARSRR